MSFDIQPSGEGACQLLNFNMENISHELSALIIGGEVDGFGAIGTELTNGINMQAPVYGTSIGSPLNSKIIDNVASYSTDVTIPRYVTAPDSKEPQTLELYLQYHYQQQLYHQHIFQLQQQPYNIFQQANYNSVSTLYDCGWCSNVIADSQTHRFGGDLNNTYTRADSHLKSMQHDRQSSTCIVTGGVSLKHSPSPKFEFHFLNCQSSNRLSSDTRSMPLISSAARSEPGSEFYNSNGRRSSGGVGSSNGSCSGQRKFMKQQVNASNIDIDYDNVVVDMSVLALSVNNEELNPVLRLFSLFRKMHFYLNDALRESFVLEHKTITPIKSSMPCTMNVQYQVKQVSRKCTLFIFEMQRLLNTNKMCNLDLYLECEQSLNMLRTLLTQADLFRRNEMEHKRGQFVTEEAQAQSEKLEQHLEQLSDQIRETHIYVHAFNWTVERANTFTVHSNIKEQQIGTSSNYEWSSNVPPLNPIPPTICDITPNEKKVDVSNDEGASVELMSSADIYGRSFPVMTSHFSEFDIERQSTRYIGYK